MVISQTANVGVAVINHKPLLYTKIEVFCRRLIKFGVMATGSLRVQVASVMTIHSARIGTAMRLVTEQLRQPEGRQRARPALPDRRCAHIRTSYAPNWCAQLLRRFRHRLVLVCRALLQLTQLSRRDQAERSNQPIAAGQHTARS